MKKAKTTTELAMEIACLRKILMEDMLKTDLGLINTLRSSECAIRAIQVAMVQDNTIAFIGPGCKPRLLQTVALQAGLIAFATAWCDCGHFQDCNKQCACSMAAIRMFQKRKPFRAAITADIVVETTAHEDGKPYPIPLKDLKEEAGEAYRRLPHVQFVETEEIKAMSRLYRSDFGADDATMKGVQELSRSIRAMQPCKEGENRVDTSSFVEAIQYTTVRLRNT